MLFFVPFLHGLEVTRASDPPVQFLCGIVPSCCVSAGVFMCASARGVCAVMDRHTRRSRRAVFIFVVAKAAAQPRSHTVSIQ